MAGEGEGGREEIRTVTYQLSDQELNQGALPEFVG